jgi:hypothetical protein
LSEDLSAQLAAFWPTRQQPFSSEKGIWAGRSFAQRPGYIGTVIVRNW